MPSDLVALVCPNCGGKLEAETDFQKCFCSYCGVELLLRYSSDGLLTAFLAKDIRASSKLQEAQSAMLVLDILKQRLVEVVNKTRELRSEFLRALNTEYRREGLHEIFAKPRSSFGKAVDWYLHHVRHLQRINYPFNESSDITMRQQPGLETTEDLFLMYQYFRENSQQKGAEKIIHYLQPVGGLHEKWVETKTEMEKIQKNIVSYRPLKN